MDTKVIIPSRSSIAAMEMMGAGSNLTERLEAATAIPPSHRSPEVAAFIEVCQLQEELAEGQWQGYFTRKEQLMADLKFTRANMLGPAPICHRFPVFMYAWEHLRHVAKIPEAEPRPPGAVGRSVMALLDSDLSLDTLLLVAPGLKALGPGERQKARLLPVYNSIVERMQVPAVAERLRQELEQLQEDRPHKLLSYEQLLASYVWQAFQEAADLVALMPHSADPDIASAFRVAGQLLPNLVPENLWFCFCSITAAGVSGGVTAPQAAGHPVVYKLRELLKRAQQGGYDMTLAACGYQLAAMGAEYGAWANHRQAGQARCSSEGSQGVARPSAFLGWLKQAKQAHTRCKAVLPTQWTEPLKGRQQAALVWKPWLQRQQREGDRWQAPAGAEVSHLHAEEVERTMDSVGDRVANSRCSGCGAAASHLRLCGGCKQVRYCSRECQRAAWPLHKGVCKAHQEGQETQSKE